MNEGVVASLGRRLVEVRERLASLSQFESRQATVEPGRHKRGVQPQRLAVAADRLLAAAAVVQRTGAVEVPPGEVGPEPDAHAEVRCRQVVLFSLLMTDAALHPGPVVSRLAPQRLVQT